MSKDKVKDKKKSAKVMAKKCASCGLDCSSAILLMTDSDKEKSKDVVHKYTRETCPKK